MEILRLTSADAQSHLMDELFEIYSYSFPKPEQKLRSTLIQMLGNNNCHFYVLCEHDKVIGLAIIYSPDYSDYAMLEYMAIHADCRNDGYGGKLFDSLTKIFHDRHMVIEIDSPVQICDDSGMRKKRLEFYKRHNCRYVEGLNFILPMSGDDMPQTWLMINSSKYKSSIPKEKLTEWITDIYVSVYYCEAEDPRINFMLSVLPNNIKLIAD